MHILGYFNLKLKIMKTIFAAISVCILMLSCSKDDTPNNRAPGAFELLTVANNSDGIDLKPTFTWKAAVDPEGDALTYTLFLDADEDPKTVIAENLSFPTFTSSDSLQLKTMFGTVVMASIGRKFLQTSCLSETYSRQDQVIPPLFLTKRFGSLAARA